MSAPRLSDEEVRLNCRSCRKTFRIRPYRRDKDYRCPACKGPLEPLECTTAPTVPDGGGEVPLDFADVPPPPPREIPVRLGKYLIDGEVARGGMGVVYKGRQEGLDRVVAIKMLLGGFSDDAEMLRRFEREARAAARLRHPNIVAVHEVGDFEGRPFFTMDYIPGQSLDGLLKSGPLPFDRGVGILRDVSFAVHHAHEHGVVHRDLKPGNILLDREGKALVTDFGLAKDVTSRSMLSVTGEVMGTPAFMSPEQAEGRNREIDRRSDVYSLGAILYRILTGRAPFEGPTIAATIYKIVHEYTQKPERINAAVPPELSAICMKALEKKPGERYATAEEFGRDLDRFLRGEPVSARPLGAVGEFRRRVRSQRRAVIAAASVAGVAVIVIAAILLLMTRSRLDLVEENLRSPELRSQALGVLVEGLARPDGFEDRDRALLLADGAIRENVDEASRGIAYAHPIPELADAYASHLPIEKPEPLRARLIGMLAALKHRESVPEILAIMRTSRGEVRLAAIRFFRVLPDARAFKALGRLATDREVGAEARGALKAQYVNKVVGLIYPNSRVGEAIAGLGESMAKYNAQLDSVLNEGRPGKSDPVLRTIALLKGSPDADKRLKAAYELGLMKDGRVRRPLLEAMSDPDDGVARMAAFSLGEAGAKGFEKEVVALLGHGRAVVRRNGAVVAGKIGDKALRPAVEAAYRRETDEEAKYAMEDALGVLR